MPKTYKRLSLLEKLGLGYLRLGQPLSTLSGGEAQRLKLAKYMSPNDKHGLSSLIMLDEPTTGLHQSDIQMLLDCLKQVVSNGHTLLVIEHHSSVLLQSDWIIELGPGAGKLGGRVTANNHPDTIHKLDTPTGRLFRTFRAKRNLNKKKSYLKLEIKDTSHKKISRLLVLKKTTFKTSMLTFHPINLS